MRPIITIDVRMVNFSGIGTYINNLIPRLVQQMHDCDFYLLGKENELQQLVKDKANVQIIECTSDIYSISEQLELKKKIPSNTDVMWSPHYNIPIFYHGKLLVTVHDVFHLAMKEFVNGAFKRFYAHFMFHCVKSKANQIIAVSNFTKSELIKYVGCKQDKVQAIYNGVDTSWLMNDCDKKSKSPYFLYVGNVKPHKNLYRLIQAFQLIEDQVSQDLVIVGKKEGFITGDDSINQYLLSNKRIHFTGFVSDKELKRLVHEADLFLFPSLYEGFGLPPLEAMASGTATAVSDIPVLKEIYKDATVYFDPYSIDDIAEKIIETMKNYPLEDLRQKGKACAKLFTWEKSAIETEEALRHLLRTNN